MGIIIVAAWLGLILFAVARLVKTSLFSMDKLTIFIASWYYTHYYFSVRFSSGNAVYFWDVLAGILAVVIYSVLFKIILSKTWVHWKNSKLRHFIYKFHGSLFHLGKLLCCEETSLSFPSVKP